MAQFYLVLNKDKQSKIWLNVPDLVVETLIRTWDIDEPKCRKEEYRKYVGNEIRKITNLKQEDIFDWGFDLNEININLADKFRKIINQWIEQISTGAFYAIAFAGQCSNCNISTMVYPFTRKITSNDKEVKALQPMFCLCMDCMNGKY